MTTSPNLILAYVGENEEGLAVARAAIEAAKGADSRLILYDADAASRLSDPLPSNWSAEGSREMFHDPLDETELLAAGREAMATLVREARASGVDAWGWLPPSRDADHLVAYANEHNADVIMVPRALESPGFFERLKGTPKADDIEEKAGRAVILIDAQPEPVDA